MIDHVSIGTDDLERSLAFYEAALQPLGIRQLMAYGPGETPDHIGFGHDRKPYF